MVAEALNAEALVHLSRGDFASGEPLLRRMLEITQEPRLRGIALQNLGSIAAQSGEMDEAQRSFQKSYECFRAARYHRGEALSLNNVGRVMLDRGEAELGAEILRRAVELARAVEDGDLLAIAMTNLGEALMREGSLAEAEEMASSALGFYAMAGNTWRRVETLKLLGDIHARHGDHDTAVACWRQGLSLAREVGARVEIDLLERRLAEPSPTDG
jgi:tetratricopeptide (TPR) repeat protein